jgi:hypothetical protein
VAVTQPVQLPTPSARSHTAPRPLRPLVASIARFDQERGPLQAAAARRGHRQPRAPEPLLCGATRAARRPSAGAEGRAVWPPGR